MHKGAALILKTVQAIENNEVKPIPQVCDGELKPAPKIFKEHGKLDFTKSAVQIRNLVRGLNPNPSAYAIVNGQNCKIHKVSVGDISLNQKEILVVQKSKVYVGVGNKESILIEELQPEGKRKMTIKEYLAGNKFESIA
jgi:methionyl-tRNA formyltransferase